MAANERFPFSEGQLLQGLPPVRPIAEIAGKYRGLISGCVKEYSDKFEVGRLGWKKVPELTISIAKVISSRFGRLLEWADDLIPEFEVPSAVVQPLYATRSFSSRESCAADVVESYSFEKMGEGCSEKISLEVRGSTLDLTISLQDDHGLAILPFSLTIMDNESKQLLLERKEFRTGAAKIRGLQPGVYAITSEQGSRVCPLVMAVK